MAASCVLRGLTSGHGFNRAVGVCLTNAASAAEGRLGIRRKLLVCIAPASLLAFLMCFSGTNFSLRHYLSGDSSPT
jgi:hypothetical protein